jgi:hypothetical protein
MPSVAFFKPSVFQSETFSTFFPARLSALPTFEFLCPCSGQFSTELKKMLVIGGLDENDLEKQCRLPE